LIRRSSRTLSRRSILALAGATAGSLALGRNVSADASSITINCPYLCQGGTGANEAVNCGPTTVAMAVNYSGAAYPSVGNVRATLGMDGPTDLDQWSWLLDVYGVPWYPVWSSDDMFASLRKGHPIVIATWMGAISRAGDFEIAYAQKSAWQGRYDGFGEGHAMLITGAADSNSSFLVHDPNVFPGDATGYYGDGTPKGQYRRYSSAEIWYNVAGYGNGLGLAIVPLSQSLAPAQRIVRIKPETDGIFEGPGGGTAPRRGTNQLDPEPNSN
jgi:hypothetical protein